MPVTTVEAETITCDNPACPGSPPALGANSRKGWLFVTIEVYGKPGRVHVYCTRTCAVADLTASAGGGS